MFCKYFGFESFKTEERGEGKKYNKKKTHSGHNGQLSTHVWRHMHVDVCVWKTISG